MKGLFREPLVHFVLLGGFSLACTVGSGRIRTIYATMSSSSKWETSSGSS